MDALGVTETKLEGKASLSNTRDPHWHICRGDAASARLSKSKGVGEQDRFKNQVDRGAS